MKKSIIFLFCIKISFAQGLLPGAYKLNISDFDSTAYNGLKSNMVSDIIPYLEDNLVWLGTGSGLSVLRDSTSIFTISSKALLEIVKIEVESLRTDSPEPVPSQTKLSSR